MGTTPHLIEDAAGDSDSSTGVSTTHSYAATDRDERRIDAPDLISTNQQAPQDIDRSRYISKSVRLAAGAVLVVVGMGGIVKHAPYSTPQAQAHEVQTSRQPRENSSQKPQKTAEEALRSFLGNSQKHSIEEIDQFFFKHKGGMSPFQMQHFITQSSSISSKIFSELEDPQLQAIALRKLEINENEKYIDGKVRFITIGNIKVHELLQQAEIYPELKASLIDFFGRTGALNWAALVRTTKTQKEKLAILNSTSVLNDEDELYKTYITFNDRGKELFLEKYTNVNNTSKDALEYFIQNSDTTLRKTIITDYLVDNEGNINFDEVMQCYPHLNTDEQGLLINTMRRDYLLRLDTEGRNFREFLANNTKYIKLRAQIIAGQQDN